MGVSTPAWAWIPELTTDWTLASPLRPRWRPVWQVQKDEAADEFAAYFTGQAPKVMITTSRKPVGVRRAWKSRHRRGGWACLTRCHVRTRPHGGLRAARTCFRSLKSSCR